MKKYLFLALLIMGGLLWLQTARLRSEKRERRRLKSNQTALMSDVEIYRTKAGKAAASNMVLNLRVSELERLRAADAESIRDLGIKLKRVESTAKTATATVVELRAKLRDTAVVRATGRGGHYRLDADISLARSVGDGRGADRARLGRMPRGECRYPPAGRASGAAALPVHPMGHQSDTAGGHVVKPAHTDRLHRLYRT